MPTGRGKICRPPNCLKNKFLLVELGVKVFLEFWHWDEWQTFENLFSLDFDKQNEFYNKKSMLHSFSCTSGQNITPYGRILLSKQWFLVPWLFTPKHWSSNHCLDSRLWSYGVIYCPDVEENEWSILFLLYYSFCLSKSREHLFSNICHSSQWHNSKNTFTPISSNQNDSFRQLGGLHIFASNCGQDMSLYGQNSLPK